MSVTLLEDIPEGAESYYHRRVPKGSKGTVLFQGLGGTEEDPVYVVNFEVGEATVCRAVAGSKLKWRR